MPTHVPPTPDNQRLQPLSRVPTISRSRARRFGSTEPNPAPKPPSNAYELRNSGGGSRWFPKTGTTFIEGSLADLGVTKTHSRPYTSTDNPYSEAQFKHAQVPARVPATGSTPSTRRARSAATSSDWYNHQHRHSGIGLLTPATVHHGLAAQAHAARRARPRHPERAPTSTSKVRLASRALSSAAIPDRERPGT